jgi:hypothetical protein
MKRPEAFENWLKPTKMDCESVAREDLWSQHWENCEGIKSLMRDSQILAAEIKHRYSHARRYSCVHQGVEHGEMAVSPHPVLAHLSGSGAVNGAGGNSKMEKPGTPDIYLGQEGEILTIK